MEGPMSLRVVECNVCGEALAAANDEELLRRMQTHSEADHSDSEWDEDSARKTIEAEAYDASDS
jgi:predicted small metal-binding protein